jgi:hypothetical protein
MRCFWCGNKSADLVRMEVVTGVSYGGNRGLGESQRVYLGLKNVCVECIRERDVLEQKSTKRAFFIALLALPAYILLLHQAPDKLYQANHTPCMALLGGILLLACWAGIRIVDFRRLASKGTKWKTLKISGENFSGK